MVSVVIKIAVIDFVDNFIDKKRDLEMNEKFLQSFEWVLTRFNPDRNLLRYLESKLNFFTAVNLDFLNILIQTFNLRFWK